ncbi:MAG: hypothetical protein HYW06_05115 [Gemmatimonadetes bacterium]|nr:hypothetical protein [Gemmatimonadota bacterium]
MSDHLAPAEEQLLEAVANSARGPKRNGVFALWMLVRTCAGVLPPDELSPRAHRRRLQALERRLTSLSVPGPLKRALTSALRELTDRSGVAAGMALQRLVAPARETLGSEVAEVIGLAARIAKEASHDHTPAH